MVKVIVEILNKQTVIKTYERAVLDLDDTTIRSLTQEAISIIKKLKLNPTAVKFKLKKSLTN